MPPLFAVRFRSVNYCTSFLLNERSNMKHKQALVTPLDFVLRILFVQIKNKNQAQLSVGLLDCSLRIETPMLGPSLSLSKSRTPPRRRSFSCARAQPAALLRLCAFSAMQRLSPTGVDARRKNTINMRSAKRRQGRAHARGLAGLGVQKRSHRAIEAIPRENPEFYD